jgi:hypothetical protein
MKNTDGKKVLNPTLPVGFPPTVVFTPDYSWPTQLLLEANPTYLRK